MTPDENDTLHNEDARRELRNRNLVVLAAYSDSNEFKKLVDDVVSGRKSPLEASMSPAFGQVMEPIAEKTLDLNPEWYQSSVPEERIGR